MKISSLELENVKRVKAVAFSPKENGLTIIGGKNGQGKTSVLDAIAWALGGEKYRPTNAQRDGSILPPKLHVVMDNGIVVDRSGVNGALKVTDPTGRKAGQALLDEFVEQLAIDLPKFMNQPSKEKARTLLKIIGLENEIKALDDEEQRTYNQRLEIGRIADQKQKYADEMQAFEGVPSEPVSALSIIQRQQKILLKNAENQKKRDQLAALKETRERLTEQLHEINRRLNEVTENILIAETDASTLMDQSTKELEESIKNIDEMNRRIRANMDKEKALDDARDMRTQYDALTAKIQAARDKRVSLLQGAKLPLPALTVENGELLYMGKAWDCMSASEQLRVSVAIVRAVNEKCGFVLLDKLEQLDEETLREFGEWLEKEGLQAICTRVSTGRECELIIEDGMARDETEEAQKTKETPKAWREGTF